MTHEDAGHYAEKHPKDRKVDPKIADAVKARTKDGEISCAAAFKVVKDLNVAPAEVGFTIDSLETKIIHCQLGIFGYAEGKKPLKSMDTVQVELREAIESALIDGKIPCMSSWEIADRFGLSKMNVTSACETLKIKVSPCQLGAFK